MSFEEGEKQPKVGETVRRAARRPARRTEGSDRLGRARHRRSHCGLGGSDDDRLVHARACGDHLESGVERPIDDGGREAFGENHAGGESCVAHAETIGEGSGSSNQGDINVAKDGVNGRFQARFIDRARVGVDGDTLDFVRRRDLVGLSMMRRTARA
ncbi:hypothetical protein [Nannocystis bainbridge]|uniref:Uncharacterized protein n=1 Tax=Nannocystis bainbridge TaxID=2995303 RepID=A0ABT5DXR4_9BACT|nr:hypothetical protein [Nannocystis bainbridge]MDC0717958.1 hypothetical protein [Nannocystis bainbridge]